MDVAYPRVIAGALEATRMTERLCIVARALATRENRQGDEFEYGSFFQFAQSPDRR